MDAIRNDIPNITTKSRLMNLTKSLQKIIWRFKSGTFTPNKDDFNCLLEIVEYVEEKEKQQLIDNQLFGKLYIYVFGQFLTYYDATPLDTIPQKELHNILDKPLRLIVTELLEQINAKWLEDYTETNIDDLSAFQPMEYSELSENLKTMVNAAINTYKPKHLGNVG